MIKYRPIIIVGLWHYNQNRPIIMVGLWHYNQYRPIIMVGLWHYNQYRPIIMVGLWHYNQYRPIIMVGLWHYNQYRPIIMVGLWHYNQYKPIIMVGLWRYSQSGVTELLIMRDPHYGRMCFKSVKTLEALQPSASALFKAKNVERLVLYPIRNCCSTVYEVGPTLKGKRHQRESGRNNDQTHYVIIYKTHECVGVF